VWGAKIPRRRRARTSDRAESKPDIAVHVKRTLEVELLVEVSMIADLMPLVRDPSHQPRPALSVAAEDKKGRAHTLFREGVEDGRSSVRIWTVVEGQCYDFAVTVDLSQRTAEDGTIAVKRAVCGSADY
jgi:hypothetical protein